MFSINSYRILINRFKDAGYRFATYLDDVCDPKVIMRHDIDLDIQLAHKLAKIEYEESVNSTYFISIRSPFYNPFTKQNAKFINRIHKLGHQIGCHINLNQWKSLSNASKELAILKIFFPFINENIVSLHSPGKLENVKQYLHFTPISNVYLEVFELKAYYVSDSTGRWIYGTPFEIEAFKEKKNIHLLTHPIWWIQDGHDAKDKYNNWLNSFRKTLKKNAAKYLPQFYKIEDDFLRNDKNI